MYIIHLTKFTWFTWPLLLFFHRWGRRYISFIHFHTFTFALSCIRFYCLLLFCFYLTESLYTLCSQNISFKILIFFWIWKKVKTWFFESVIDVVIFSLNCFLSGYPVFVQAPGKPVTIENFGFIVLHSVPSCFDCITEFQCWIKDINSLGDQSCQIETDWSNKLRLCHVHFILCILVISSCYFINEV